MANVNWLVKQILLITVVVIMSLKQFARPVNLIKLMYLSTKVHLFWRKLYQKRGALNNIFSILSTYSYLFLSKPKFFKRPFDSFP